MGLGYRNSMPPYQDKPSGMEAMVSKLLGFTPEQMQETLATFRDTILQVGATLNRVEAKQDAILARLEALENGRHDDSYSDGTAVLIHGPRAVVGGVDIVGSDTTVRSG